MPIVASRGAEIRRLLSELSDPKRRPAAVMRLRSLGPRVVPHVSDEIKTLNAEARAGLLEALGEVNTEDAKSLKKRLARIDTRPATRGLRDSAVDAYERGALVGSNAKPEGPLDVLRRLPLPRSTEPAAVSRERGEAHLALAREGSRLARKDLLLSLATLSGLRSRLYCEAAALIGDLEFLRPLALLAHTRAEAIAAIASIAAREQLTARSKALRDLDPALRPIVAQALAKGSTF